MSAITLVDRMAYVAPASATEIVTSWVGFPCHYERAEIWIDAKSVASGSLLVDLDSSIDTTQVEQVDQWAVSAAGLQVHSVAIELGPLVRLKFSSSAATSAIISVWIIPKQS